MKYWLYVSVFVLFATIAAVHGYFLSSGPIWPEWVGGLVVFLLMTGLFYRWFWQLDRPYRQDWREAVLVTLFYCSAAVGLFVAVIRQEGNFAADSGWRSAVTTAGYFALWVATHTILRASVFERSDPKTFRKGGGCCGGHHPHH